VATSFSSIDNSGYAYRQLSPTSERYQSFAGSASVVAVLPTGPSGMMGREFVFTLRTTSSNTLSIQSNSGSTLKTITGTGSGGVAFAVWVDASNAYVAIP
jgi:hypothetical protein